MKKQCCYPTILEGKTDICPFPEKSCRTNCEFFKEHLTKEELLQQALETLNKIIQHTPGSVIGCHGDKCREAWCYSCNGEYDANEAIKQIHADCGEAVKTITAIRSHLDNTKDEEPMATSTPEVSREHLIAIAEMCGILGNYRTREMVDAVVGYARVVLNDVAVQEAFVRANPAHIPTGMVLVGWLDGRGRFFYADDPLYKDRHEGMCEVFAAAKGE